MKFIAVFFALVALVAATVEASATVDPYQLVERNCAKQSGITREQAKQIAALEFPDEEEVHKYVLCGASKMGIFGDDEESQKINRVLNECVLESKNSNLTDHARAYRIFQCMLKTDIGDTLKKGIEVLTKTSNAEQQ